MISGLDRKIDDGFTHSKEKFSSIETKQDHTNGRVRKLEQWKFIAIGVVVALNLIGVPLMLKFLESRLFP